MQKMITLLFSWGGRISRREYFIWLVLNSLLTSFLPLIIFILMVFLLQNFSLIFLIIALVIWGVARFAGIYISINLIVKRLHDLWNPWTNIFLLVIPFFNIYYFLRLLFQKWSDNENEFGISRIYEQKISLVLPIVLIVLFFGAFVGGSMYLVTWILKDSTWWYQSLLKNPVIEKILWSVSWILKNSEAYKLSLQEITTNPMLKDIYWTFTVWSLPMWSISSVWPDGEASLQLSLVWDKNSWNIYVDLQKKYGKRKILHMVSIDSHNNQESIMVNENSVLQTTTPTTTIVSGMVTYTSVWWFSLQYPNNRTVQENPVGSSVSFLAPIDEHTTRASISLIMVKLPDDMSLDAQQAVLDAQMQSWTSLPFSTGISNQNIIINWLKAKKVIYSWMQGQKKFIWQQVYLIHNAVEYTFSYIASSDTFYDFSAPIDAIIQSLSL